MNLGDMENLILVQLQQPGANFTGGAPTWPANAQFGQGLVDFCINEGYKHAMGDLDELEIGLVSFPITSTVQTYKYTIPPAAGNFAQIASVGHVYYQPIGFTYTREFRPGRELVSWMQFQTYTSQGWIEPYSFTNLPNVCTIDPLLTSLYFFPGCANAGDIITVQYTPFPTAGAVNCPTLVLPADTPVLPVDCHMAIVNFALSLLWIRARELATATVYKQQYAADIADILRTYARKHHGDTIRVEPFLDSLSIGNL